MSLLDLLSDFSKSNPVRFHMPGHKGRMKFPNPYEIDVTEFGEFDDLHNAKGAISEIEDNISSLYKSDSAKLLVNGSTVGIIASIFAMIEEKDAVLVSRYAHKSILNSLILRKAKVVFFNQEFDEYGIAKPIKINELQNIVKSNKDIKLVIITSPTYEGVDNNIKDINSVLSEKDIPLFVDAAHGAHFGLYDETFSHPITSGCEIAVTSLHKTLPFFTQSAALLISKKGKKYEEKINFYLNCFESSSPSYILMAGADKGVELLKKEGESLFKQYSRNLNDFYNRSKKFKNIKIIDYEYKDKGKLVIVANSSKGIDIIANIMEKSGVFPEMITPTYILCMSSIMNNNDDFERLYSCLENADSKIGMLKEDEKKNREGFRLTYPIPKLRLPMYEALKKDVQYLPIEDAVGMISGGIIDIFPPGVPVVLPGEEIEKDIIGLVKNAKEHNIIIRGMVDGKIPVI